MKRDDSSVEEFKQEIFKTNKVRQDSDNVKSEVKIQEEYIPRPSNDLAEIDG